MAEEIRPGCRFGCLEVVEKAGKDRNNYTVWKCRCDCGNITELDSRTIRRKSHMDCGCGRYKVLNSRDVSGMQFGRLRAEYPTGELKNGWPVWHCSCECGGQKDVPLNRLENGAVRSCGCLHSPPVPELKGQRFGSLTVLEYAGKRDQHQHYWKCRCDCGKELYVRQRYLLSGRTTSCGCRRKENILKNVGIFEGTSLTKIEASSRHRISAANTSGCTGVYRRKRDGKWCAQITFKGKTYFLGSFPQKEEAIQARRKGEEMFDDFLAYYHSLKDA